MAILTPFPVMQFFDDNGDPLVGGKVYTYAAGTTTPQATYTDSTGNTANSNPVILDAAGRADIWLGTSLYYWVVTDSTGYQIWTADNIGQQTTAGDVVGPASSTDNAVVRFNGTTGKLVQNSNVTISDAGAISAASVSLTTALPIASGGTGATTASAARSVLGLGTFATQNGGTTRGDITVSSDTLTWTLANNAVTAAKIANGAVNGAKLSGGQSVTAPIYGIRAWANADGASGSSTCTIRGSGNVSSVTRTSTGEFNVTMTTPMDDANYAVSVGCGGAGAGLKTAISIVSNQVFTIYVLDYHDDWHNPPYLTFTVIR